MRHLFSGAFLVLMGACSEAPADLPEDPNGEVAPFFPEAPVLPALPAAEPIPPEVPRDPAAATPPVMTPCPAGWRTDATSIAEVDTCDPWPVQGRADCAGSEAHFPGEPSCARIGTECPASVWPSDLPADAAILYVRAGAPAGGDGTRNAPLATINAASQRAQSGTIIALSKGTFNEAVSLRSGVTLWGACVAETHVTCSGHSRDQGVITATGSRVVIKNLRISGGRPGLWVGPRRSMHVEEVLIEGASGVGWALLSGGRGTAQSVVVRDTERFSDDGSNGSGVFVVGGGIIEITRAVLERNRTVGLFAADAGSRVEAEDIAIIDTQPATNGEVGRGIQTQENAHIALTRAVIEDCKEMAATINGATFSGVDLIIRDTHARQQDQGFGLGMLLGEGAEVDLSRVLFERNRQAAIQIMEGSRLTISDAVVQDTDSNQTGEQGFGLQIEGGHAELNRTLLLRNRDAGIWAEGPASTLSGEDIILRATRSREIDRGTGVGLLAFDGASVTGSRILAVHNHSAGLFADGAGTSLRASDVVVRDTRVRDSDGLLGNGVIIQAGATAELGPVHLLRNHGIALLVTTSTVHLFDAVVSDTLGWSGEIEGGRGLEASSGAAVRLDRAVFDRNRDCALMVEGAGTTLDGTDLAIRDTLGRQLDGDKGVGLAVQHGAQARLERATLERNHYVGLMVSCGAAQLQATDLIVRDTETAGDERGFGLQVSRGAEAEVTRGLFERNRDWNIIVGLANASLQLTDVTVRKTKSKLDGTSGKGLAVLVDASVNVERILLEKNRSASISLAFSGQLSGSDITIRGSLPQENGDHGYGFEVTKGSVVDAERISIENSFTHGLYVGGATTSVRLQDLTIRDTQLNTVGVSGGGLTVHQGAQAELSRVVVRNSEGTGVMVFGSGSRLVASDLWVDETKHCAEGSQCGGSGIGAFCAGAMELSRFRVENSALAGLHLGHGTENLEECDTGGLMDLHQGEVANNTIGAAITTKNYDLERMMDRVVFRSNERKLVSSALPVPKIEVPVSETPEIPDG